MGTRRRWSRRQVTCKEGNGETTLLIEWRYSGDKKILHGISCDNPRLGGIDNWDCGWSCWDEVSEGKE